MIHQGILDQRTTSETIRHNTLQLWLMTERERRSFHTTLWNSAGRDSEKWQHLELKLSEREHNRYVFRKPSESARKLVVCHDFFPLSFLVSHWIDYSPEERGLNPKVLHAHAYVVYQVTKWNLQWNVKSKSEILSYMKWLVASFTAHLSAACIINAADTKRHSWHRRNQFVFPAIVCLKWP